MKQDEIVTEGQDKLVKFFYVVAALSLLAFAVWCLGLQPIVNAIAISIAIVLTITAWLGIDWAKHT